MTGDTTPPVQPASQFDGEKTKVLLLDDDKFLVEMYSMKFIQAGYTVQVALSTDEALDILRTGFVPDVVLFDLTMPVRDGFSFLQSVKEEKLASGAKFIALTNQTEDADKEKAAELGVSSYIVKASMIPSEVVQAVDKEMTRK